MKKFHKTPLAIAMGATLLPLTANIAQAGANPFALSEMGSGYMQTAEAKPADQGGMDKMKDGACGEGKCGASMKQGAAADKKAVEAKCAANKAGAKPAAGAPAGETPKPEGSKQ